MKTQCAYAFPGVHHSKDRVTVYTGSTIPTVLCGFHAQPVWLSTVINTLAQEVQ